jgi:glutamyl-tRNA reductase
MSFLVVGCSHRNTPLAVRERLAFSGTQARRAIAEFRQIFPRLEVVLLSTCNRVELYVGGEEGASGEEQRADEEGLPSLEEIAGFLGQFHRIPPPEILEHLYSRAGEEAVRHLFSVASSLDSMVVGEPQILSQVKQAHQLAAEAQGAGPLLDGLFQAAARVARRVAGETCIHQRRVSIPSVAVADFAQQIFERFDDKKTLVIGAGEMAEETLRYLRDQGARDLTVINRHDDRGRDLAQRWQGKALSWDCLPASLAEADLVISTTGAEEPIVTLGQFAAIESARGGRPLFVLDLAVPRDFDPAIGGRPGVYLYSIDDLRQACETNRGQRDKEIPAVQRIIQQETEAFLTEINHRQTTPLIQRLRQGWEKPKDEELQRLFHKLPELGERERDEVRQAFDRLVNKLLHPPMESLRRASRHGVPRGLLDAMVRLFQLKD